jgi:hypothetical protein
MFELNENLEAVELKIRDVGGQRCSNAFELNTQTTHGKSNSSFLRLERSAS